MDSGVSFSELRSFTAEENRRWKTWFGEHPPALDLLCDIAGSSTVRTLLRHIFGVDLRYSHLLLALDLPDIKSLPHATVGELFAIGEQADRKLREFLARASSKDWDEIVPLGFLDLKASKRKIMAQVALHGVHHRAQLATFLREQGYKQDWLHDFVVSSVFP
ncbi:MAG: DinB family protein [Terriglobales bacterium]